MKRPPLAHAPRFDVEMAASLAERLYGIAGLASQLASERDQNFFIAAETGEKFVLKIANALEEPALLAAQNEVLTYLKQRLSFCPTLIPTLSGKEIAQVESPEGVVNFVRLVRYLPGVLLAETRPHSHALLRDLGKKLGQLDRHLSSFDHPAFHRDFHWDLANGLRVIHEYSNLISDAALRELANRCAMAFARDIGPLLSQVRRSTIHNDANDYNVLVTAGDRDAKKLQSVVGLIDFGDMVWSYTVGDLAVAIAYVILDTPDPLATATQVLGGYIEEYPLNDVEIDVLYGLILMRLCMSVSLAAYQHQQRPEDSYLEISQHSIETGLPALASIDWRVATETFRGCD